MKNFESTLGCCTAQALARNNCPASRGPELAETHDEEETQETWSASCVCCGRTFEADADDITEPMCARCEFDIEPENHY